MSKKKVTVKKTEPRPVNVKQELDTETMAEAIARLIRAMENGKELFPKEQEAAT